MGSIFGAPAALCAYALYKGLSEEEEMEAESAESDDESQSEDGSPAYDSVQPAPADDAPVAPGRGTAMMLLLLDDEKAPDESGRQVFEPPLAETATRAPPV